MREEKEKEDELLVLLWTNFTRSIEFPFFFFNDLGRTLQGKLAIQHLSCNENTCPRNYGSAITTAAYLNDRLPEQTRAQTCSKGTPLNRLRWAGATRLSLLNVHRRNSHSRLLSNSLCSTSSHKFVPLFTMFIRDEKIYLKYIRKRKCEGVSSFQRLTRLTRCGIFLN